VDARVAALLDTSILIALCQSEESTPNLSDFDEVYVSVISWNEMLLGAHVTDNLRAYKERSARLVYLQSKFGEGIPFDDDCQEMFGELLLRVEQRGGSVTAHRFDRMIAATAMAKNLVLVTRNAKDLRMFDGILDVVER